MIHRLLVLLLAAMVLSGCGGSAPGLETLPGPEGEYVQAKRAFDAGDNIRAIELLSAFVEAHPGSNQLDQVLFLLGRAHQRTGENLLAVEDFDRLIRDFPQSPVREQAEFERAQSHLAEARSPALDPESTETALSLLRAYLIHYPQGAYAVPARQGIGECLEKLATKAFLNAEIYCRLHRDGAAVIYLEKALATKQDFSRAGEALAELARIRQRMGQLDKAREAWKQLLDYATPERIQKQNRLEELRREAEQALRGLSAGDGEG